jgi:hypothetical protein
MLRPDQPLSASRDWSATELLGRGEPPESASAKHLVTHVLTEEAFASSAVCAAVQAIHASHVKNGAPSDIPFRSRLFIDHFAGEDASMRDVLRAAAKFGAPREEVWPFEEQLADREPSFNAVREAASGWSPIEYRRIYEEGEERLDVIKRAVAAGYLVVFGALFDENADNASVREPVFHDDVGTDALCIGGYDQGGFDVLTTRGELYAERGWVRLSPKYLAWEGARDFWIVDAKLPVVPAAVEEEEPATVNPAGDAPLPAATLPEGQRVMIVTPEGDHELAHLLRGEP